MDSRLVVGRVSSGVGRCWSGGRVGDGELGDAPRSGHLERGVVSVFRTSVMGLAYAASCDTPTSPAPRNPKLSGPWPNLNPSERISTSPHLHRS